MEIVWKIEPEEIETLRDFVASYRDNAFVRRRINKNVEDPLQSVEIAWFWEVLVGALLTSQQRSGPDSYVVRFIRTQPFPLSYTFYEEASDPEKAGRRVLQAFGGIRFNKRIANHLARNYAALSEGLWEETRVVFERLVNQDSPMLERRAAEFLSKYFVGLVPKQSRNLLQGMGLTKYEIPLDSRITKWLNNFGFPIHLSAGRLANRHYYNFVSDGVQAMCKACDILPCVFDAAVFVSYDTGWTKENAVW
jgi:hypothetical protein